MFLTWDAEWHGATEQNLNDGQRFREGKGCVKSGPGARESDREERAAQRRVVAVQAAAVGADNLHHDGETQSLPDIG